MKKYIPYIVLMISVVLLLNFCENKSIQSRAYDKYSEIYEYKPDAREYTARDGTLVNYNRVLELRLNDISKVNDSLENYIKKLKINDTRTLTVYDTKYIVDTIFIPLEKDTISGITRFDKRDTNYYISGRVLEDSLFIDRIEIPNKVGVTTGYKKSGIFSKDLVVTITNSNPLVEIGEISSFVFKENKKWYQKDWVKIVGGAVVGGIIIKATN